MFGNVVNSHCEWSEKVSLNIFRSDCFKSLEDAVYCLERWKLNFCWLHLHCISQHNEAVDWRKNPSLVVCKISVNDLMFYLFCIIYFSSTRCHDFLSKIKIHLMCFKGFVSHKCGRVWNSSHKAPRAPLDQKVCQKVLITNEWLMNEFHCRPV